jgi:hypothetical protein
MNPVTTQRFGLNDDSASTRITATGQTCFVVRLASSELTRSSAG